jgi:predicted nucleotidyltransferase
MRKSSSTLDHLLSPLIQGVLTATLLNRKEEWYLSDLAAHLGVGPSSLQRTLAKLIRSGILIQRRDGNRVYYRPDPDSPILPELGAILIKTTGIAEPLAAALEPLAGNIRVAFIHGSVAESRERSESDIDLIIVGNASGPDLTAALHPAEDRLGREINFTRYTTNEFRSKIEAGHHFLTSLLDKKRIFLIGDEDELEKLTGRKPSGSGADKQERA